MSPASLLESILQLLFPDRCASCRRFGELFCAGCRAKLSPYPPDERAWPASLAQVQIAYLFQPPLREAIHQLKYRKHQRIARPLGQLLAKHMAAQASSFEAVAAVPLHQSRLAERGFNQAEALAREVAGALRLPLISGPLVRLRATEQQAKLNASGRAENMRDAFGWRGAAPPARIILVDDVYTTGATMGACAEALLAAGTGTVAGLALARSRLT